MAYILHIETATTVCSVAIAQDGTGLVENRNTAPFEHAESLHVYIQSVLRDLDLGPKDLSAIAVSRGPGSYTGLRIGVSAAKGMAYALGIPLIAIDTLQAMAFGAIEMESDDAYYCPMLDARRMEVYCAVYDKDLQPVIPTQALILTPESIKQFELGKPIYFLGDGMPKAQELLQDLDQPEFIEDYPISSQDMIDLAWAKFQNKQFEDVAYFEPFYLKEFMIGPKP